MANEFKIKNGLVVSGSADVEQNLTVNGILTAKQYNVSLISSSILFESGSTQFGNTLDDNHLFTGSIKVTGSISLNGQAIGTGKLDETTFQNYTSSTDSRLGLLENSTGSIRNDFNSFTSSYTNVSGSLDSRLDTLETLSGSFTGSFSGSFVGDGTNLFNIPASGVTGLNLTQIADGSVTASVSNTNGLRVNSKSEITGSLIVTNGITGSIDYSNLTNVPTLVSGSSQISITGTTGYSTFSSSISSSIDLLSSSIATTDSNQNTRLGLLETSTGSLNSFTSSASGRLTSIETSTGSLNSFTSSALTRVSAIETSTSSLNSFTSSALTRVSAIETSTGSLNSFTSSIDTTIKTKLNTENVISGSVQVNITGTTGYSTFSSSVSSSIGSLSSSVATTTNNLSSSIDTLSGSISTTNLNQSNRIGNLEVSTGSLNSFTSSINTTIKNKLNTDGVISGSVQVDITSTTGYSTFSSSIATTDLNQNNRLDSIQTSTGSLNSFTSSIDTTIKNKLNTDGVISGSSQVLNGTTIHSGTFFNGISVVSGSSQVVFSGITGVPSGIVSGSSQVLLSSGIWSSSAQLPSGIVSGSSQVSFGGIDNVPSGLVSGSSQVLNGTTIHSGTFFNGISVVSGSGQIAFGGITGVPSGLVSGSSQVDITSTTNYTSFSSSIATTDSNQNTRLGLIETSTGSLNSFTSSIDTTIKTKLNSDGVISGSSQISLSQTNGYSAFSSSIASTDFVQDGRLTSIESKTGSYATTGSNVFKGDQTISGSVTITENLRVFGSSSITYVTSSQLRVEDNIITVNTASPGSRFGGLEVHDSGSVGIATGSLLWDSINNRWVYQNSSEATYGGGVLLSGPRSSGSLGSELTLTSGKIARSAGGDHLNDSIITEYGGTTIGVNGGLDVTGSINVGGGGKLTVATVGGDEGGEILLGKAATNTTLAGDGITIDIWQNRLRFFEQGGNARGAFLDISTLANGVGTNLLGSAATASYVEFSNVANKPTLVSGSSQITFLSIGSIPSGLVSGSSQVLLSSGIWSGSAQLPSGIISGSAQLPSGTVSGSSQITYGSITGIPSGIVSGSSQILLSSGIWSSSAQLPSGVVSGSSQVLNGTTIHSGSFFNGISVVSGSGQISFNGITDKPTLVSGSSQITYGSLTGIPSGIISGSSQVSFGSISGIPSGLVSGSSQVSFGSISGVPSGLVSGSSQVLSGTGIWSGSAQLPSGVVSGSSQIIYGSISSIPSGIVSGSSQILLSSGIWSGSAQLPSGIVSSSLQTIANLPSGTVSGSSQIILTSGQVTTGLGYTPYNATNPSGYISSITSGNVTTALGYTPYNATNPSGYISSITSGNVTTALGFTPYNATNPSGYITGISFANVSSKPTTLSGYGITDSVKTNGTLTGNIDSDWGESFTTFDPVPSGTPPLSSPNIRTVNIGNNFARRTQLAFDYASDVAYFRRRNDSGWQTWREFIHSGNIGSQTVATAGALSSMNISQFTNNSGYLTSITSGNVTTALGYTPYNATNPSGYISSITSGNVTTALGYTPYNATNPSGYISSITSGNVTTALGYTPYNATNPNGYITGISFANVSSKPTTISGYGITDAITTGNIGSQSVSYASSAGSAPNASNLNSMYGVSTGGGNGLKFWGGSDLYKIHMGSSAEYYYGPVTDYSIKCNIDSNGSTRGFTWGQSGVTPIAALNVGNGNMQIAGTFTTGGSILPLSNNSVNLGSVSLGWANVYTNDLHLSNMSKPEGNDIDGTKGTWTIQEGAENLYIINNNNGKKFKINLEEII